MQSSPAGSLNRTPTARPTVKLFAKGDCSPTVSLNEDTESGDCVMVEVAHEPQRASPSQTMTSIPHHLRSKAAGVNSVKKASRILAVGLFTTQERSSCTISGSTNKSKEDKKRPQFDPTRMTLIHGNNYYTLNYLCEHTVYSCKTYIRLKLINIIIRDNHRNLTKVIQLHTLQQQ